MISIATIAVAAEPPPETAPAPPAPTHGKLPSAAALISRYIHAIGGEDLIRNTRSMHVTCKLEVPAQRITGDMEIFSAAPDRYLVKSSIAGIGTSLAGYNSPFGWTKDSASGAHLVGGKQIEEMREKADFNSVLHDSTRFKTMEVMEITGFQGQTCHKLHLIRHSGHESFEYFDIETGLRAGQSTTLDTPRGKIEQITTESDYKKFGNRLIATRQVQKIEKQEIVMTIVAVEFDNVDTAVFDPPADVKALIEKSKEPATPAAETPPPAPQSPSKP